MAEHKQPPISVLEAVDNLSTLAELSGDASSYFTEHAQPEREGEKVYSWVDPSRIEMNQEKIKESLKVVYDYLKHIYDEDRGSLKQSDTQKGIQAIMVLVGEAGQKLDRFTKLFKGVHGGGVTQLSEFQDLQKLYLTKIIKRFHEKSKEEPYAELSDEEKRAIEKRGIKDLNEVKSDRKYELFYIVQEDGSAFFDRNLLRHIKLVGVFDHLLSSYEGDDPLLQIKALFDRDMHETAKEILKLAGSQLDGYYKEALSQRKRPFVSSINKALMALMLAANSANLLYNSTSGKSCTNYYRDFHYYLRQALNSDQYHRFLAHPPKESHHFARLLLNLSHLLCCFYFMRIGSHKESLDFLHKLMNRKKGENKEGDSLWRELLSEDEAIRKLLNRYPSGPLMKSLDVIQSDEEAEGFDPMAQDNIPSQLYNLSFDSEHISFLRIPSPTSQNQIDKAEVAVEFQGLIRYQKSRSDNQKHLMFNLQDRTSWQEHTRCNTLEQFSKKAEFTGNFTIVSLPKQTDFYLQKEEYQELNNAESFKKQFLEQITSGPVCGFFFPSELNTKEFKEFLPLAIERVHEMFYNNQNVITLRNRLDFIEIVYQLIYLKIIEIIKPDSVSFTDKDSLDEGMSATCSFFCFLRLLTDSSSWNENEKDFLRWMLYIPALLVRERAIESECFKRLISSISYLNSELDERRDQIIDPLAKLYSRDLFNKLKLGRCF